MLHPENIDDSTENLKNLYNPDLINEISNHLMSIPVFSSKLYSKIKVHIDELRKSDLSKTNSLILLSDIKKEADNYNSKKTSFNKFFGGHQYHLGHYFRHLFQTVNYIYQLNLSGDRLFLLNR